MIGTQDMEKIEALVEINECELPNANFERVGCQEANLDFIALINTVGSSENFRINLIMESTWKGK